MSNLIPIGEEFVNLKTICQYAIQSGFLPQSIKTPQQAVIIALKGRELGIPPMQAFAQIAVINGKPAMGAELMLGMIYKSHPNAVINTTSNCVNRAAIRAARRPGLPLQEFEFTHNDAERAGLTTKQTWKQYPKTMLYWRCVSMMARQLFPDAIMGISHTPEELGAETTEDGEIVDITPTALAEAPSQGAGNGDAARAAMPPMARDEPGRDDKSGVHTTAVISPDGGAKAKAVGGAAKTSPSNPPATVERATAGTSPSEPPAKRIGDIRGREAPVLEEPTTLSPVYNGKTKAERDAFKAECFKFGIVGQDDLKKVSRECLGLQMDAIPARINELLEMGDFGT